MAKLKTSFFVKIVEPNMPVGKGNAMHVRNGTQLLKKLFKKKKK